MGQDSSAGRVSRWARIDALLDAGLDVDPSQRAAWLAEQEASETLRREVLELLEEADVPAEGLMPEHFAGGALMREILTRGFHEPVQGTRIGAWRLLDKLGQGGMGSVFRAERADGAFEQETALKLIRPDVWNDDVGRRLETERQILAQLDHPNIARLLDGGSTADGQPYLVMELVQGQPIDRYCDDRNLSLDQRLDLFLDVCQAVQHAHQALVVHRDLKPSNVLVTSEGRVKLLDFGIAQALEPDVRDADPVTQAVDRIMTPQYASPEQILGQPVTTATDVYQLGLLLFELLVGERAQKADGRPLPGLMLAICREPAERPSSRAKAMAQGGSVAAARDMAPQRWVRRLQGDLDAIVTRALRKEPEQRYASARHFGDDVVRHREGLPVEARPAEMAYRLRCFLKRHRRSAAWTALGLALIVWVSAFYWGERLRAAREAERARQVEGVMASLFEYPRVTDSGQPPQMIDFVDHASVLVRQHLEGQPASQARLLARLARTYMSIGAFDQAARAYGEAIGLAGEAATPERASWTYQRGRSQHFSGALHAAEESFREAAELQRTLHGPDHLLTLTVEVELADLLHSLARLHEAQTLLEPAVVRLQAEVDRDPDGRSARELYVQAQGYLGNVLRDRGLYDAAENAYAVAVTGVSDLLGELDARTSNHSLQFARLLTLQGRYEESEARLKQDLERLDAVYFGEHPLVAIAHRELALAAMLQNQLDLAREHLETSYRVSEQWLESDHPTIPRLKAIEAEIERRMGRFPESIEISKQALVFFDELDLPQHPSAIETCITLARSLRELDQPLPNWAQGPLEACRSAAENELASGDPRAESLRHVSRRQPEDTP